MRLQVKELVIVKESQLHVNQFPQAVILPCFHNFSVYSLADREIQQVHVHLDFKTVLVCHAVGNPYLARIADIYAVLVVFLQDKILDQPYGFLHFRVGHQLGNFFFRQFFRNRFRFYGLCLRFILHSFQNICHKSGSFPFLLYTVADKRNRFLPENGEPSLHFQVS